MRKEDFYELLDIDSPADFQYFENLAAYLESDDDFKFEEVVTLVEGMDKKVFSQLVGDYFEELTDCIPGSEAVLFGTLETVSKVFRGMAQNCDDEAMQVQLAEELENFRVWYSRDSKAYVSDIDTLEETTMPLRDALVCARVERMDGTKYQYDFIECENYTMEEYVVSFGDMVTAVQYDDEDETVPTMIERPLEELN